MGGSIAKRSYKNINDINFLAKIRYQTAKMVTVGGSILTFVQKHTITAAKNDIV